jgi:hypothetical protein
MPNALRAFHNSELNLLGRFARVGYSAAEIANSRQNGEDLVATRSQSETSLFQICKL